MKSTFTPDTLSVLDARGDTTLSWNPANPTDVADARAQVELLRTQGYTFFLVDGSPAPETITAGLAVLTCRRIPAEAVVQPAATPPVPDPTPIAALGLSPRAEAALRRANLRTLGALVPRTEAELLALHGFGVGSLAIVKTALAARGLSLSTTPGAPAAPEPRRVVATRPTVGG